MYIGMSENLEKSHNLLRSLLLLQIVPKTIEVTIICFNQMLKVFFQLFVIVNEC